MIFIIIGCLLLLTLIDFVMPRTVIFLLLSVLIIVTIEQSLGTPRNIRQVELYSDFDEVEVLSAVPDSKQDNLVYFLITAENMDRPLYIQIELTEEQRNQMMKQQRESQRQRGKLMMQFIKGENVTIQDKREYKFEVDRPQMQVLPEKSIQQGVRGNIQHAPQEGLNPP